MLILPMLCCECTSVDLDCGSDLHSDSDLDDDLLMACCEHALVALEHDFDFDFDSDLMLILLLLCC